MELGFTRHGDELFKTQSLLYSKIGILEHNLKSCRGRRRDARTGEGELGGSRGGRGNHVLVDYEVGRDPGTGGTLSSLGTRHGVT